MRSIELKIKIKELAYEARTNRKEAAKAYASGNYMLGNNLTNHRKLAIRSEARATQLAYAFLRGRTYESVEPTAKTTPRWSAVKRMVQQYGNTGFCHKSWLKGYLHEEDWDVKETATG